MTTHEQRQQRVANGSRRKRDLEAVEDRPDFGAYAQHFPDAHPGDVRSCAWSAWARQGDYEKTIPTVERVRELLVEKGYMKAQS